MLCYVICYFISSHLSCGTCYHPLMGTAYSRAPQVGNKPIATSFKNQSASLCAPFLQAPSIWLCFCGCCWALSSCFGGHQTQDLLLDQHRPAQSPRELGLSTHPNPDFAVICCMSALSLTTWPPAVPTACPCPQIISYQHQVLPPHPSPFPQAIYEAVEQPRALHTFLFMPGWPWSWGDLCRVTSSWAAQELLGPWTAVDTSSGPEPSPLALNTSLTGPWWENTSCRSSMESKGERGTSGLIFTLHLLRGPKATELLTGLNSKWLKSWLGRSLQAHVHTQVLLGPAWLLKKPRWCCGDRAQTLTASAREVRAAPLMASGFSWHSTDRTSTACFSSLSSGWRK